MVSVAPYINDSLGCTHSTAQSRFEVSEESIQRVLKSGVVDIVLHWAKAKQDIDMKKKLKAAASGDVGAALAALEPASAPMEGGVNCGAGGRCSVAMAVAAADGRSCVPAGTVVL